MRKQGATYTQMSGESIPPNLFVGLNSDGKVVLPQNAKAIIGVSAQYVQSGRQVAFPVIQSGYAQIQLAEPVESGDRLKPGDKGKALKGGPGDLTYLIAEHSGGKDQVISAFFQICTVPNQPASGGND